MSSKQWIIDNIDSYITADELIQAAQNELKITRKAILKTIRKIKNNIDEFPHVCLKIKIVLFLILENNHLIKDDCLRSYINYTTTKWNQLDLTVLNNYYIVVDQTRYWGLPNSIQLLKNR